MRLAASLRGYVSKAPDWDSQDAFAENPERGRFAVADGMTHASYMSKQFAQTLVDTFVSSGANPIEDFVVGESPLDSLRDAPATGPQPVPWFAKQLRKIWRKEIEDLYLPEAKEFLRAKWTSGESASHATFAGIQCTDSGNEVQVLVVGDCYVFVCPVGADVRVITGAGSSVNGAPRSVSVGATNRREVFDQPVVESVPLGGVPTCLLLCTDWVGRRLAREVEAHRHGWPPTFKRLVDIRHQSEFNRWVVEARRADTSGDPADDVTLLVVRVHPSVPGGPTAARPVDLAGPSQVPAPVVIAQAVPSAEAPPPSDAPPDAVGIAVPASPAAVSPVPDAPRESVPPVEPDAPPAHRPPPEPSAPVAEPPESHSAPAQVHAAVATVPSAPLAPPTTPGFTRSIRVLVPIIVVAALLFAWVQRRNLEGRMLPVVGVVTLLLVSAGWALRSMRRGKPAPDAATGTDASRVRSR